jgi:18S rRNA (guanine1575-N7)-methyltransferase
MGSSTAPSPSPPSNGCAPLGARVAASPRSRSHRSPARRRRVASHARSPFSPCAPSPTAQLCHAETSEHNPRKRLATFFHSLYKSLRRGARAVLQFYPQNPEQLQLITASAMRAGFGGGLVVDYPHSTRAKKYFLCLLAGPPDPSAPLPSGLGADAAEPPDAVLNVGRSRLHAKRAGGGKSKRAPVKGRDWVVRKKETQRRQGKLVRDDSKYTARRRGPTF